MNMLTPCFFLMLLQLKTTGILGVKKKGIFLVIITKLFVISIGRDKI